MDMQTRPITIRRIGHMRARKRASCAVRLTLKADAPKSASFTTPSFPMRTFAPYRKEKRRASDVRPAAVPRQNGPDSSRFLPSCTANPTGRPYLQVPVNNFFAVEVFESQQELRIRYKAQAREAEEAKN